MMAKPQVIIMWSGVVLIALGVILISVQMVLQIAVPAFEAPSRSLGLEGLGAKASVQTTYVGLVLVVVGAFLEIVGYVGARPRLDHPGNKQ